MDTIAVVTPTFNSEAFLDATIASVVTQPGDFRIRYHIQDGRSTDGTLQIIRRWQRLVEEYPISCGGLELTVESVPDRGMYDAINKGFAHIDLTNCAYMTWINSDDLLAPGSLATVMAIKRDAAVSWMTGRSALINAEGSIIDVFADHFFSRADLEAGLYDGRGREDGRFVMQEGTFWMPWLWEATGGVESGFKLAGDWHLWRCFAAHAPLTSVRTYWVSIEKEQGSFRAISLPIMLRSIKRKVSCSSHAMPSVKNGHISHMIYRRSDGARRVRITSVLDLGSRDFLIV